MKNKRLYFDWIALVIWMSLIFFMSNQPGEISDKQSDLVIKIFSIIGLELNDKFGEFATLIVRKAAHFTEYFVLYFLSYNVLSYYNKTLKSIVYAFIVVVGYSISDEIHQYFIPGRNMALIDVLIDCSGGMVAAIINYIRVNRQLKFTKRINRKTILS